MHTLAALTCFFSCSMVIGLLSTCLRWATSCCLICAMWSSVDGQDSVNTVCTLTENRGSLCRRAHVSLADAGVSSA